jgi:hypothetical protein
MVAGAIMRSPLRALLGSLALGGLVVLAAACGNGSSGGSGQYADKCDLACVPPSGPCGAEDSASCQTSCTTALEGLSVACAQCVVEHSGWAGTTCTCSGGNCSEDSFGPGTNSGGSGPDICDPATATRCSGFELAKTTGSDCKALCAVAP